MGEENEAGGSALNQSGSPLKQRIRIKHLFDDSSKRPSCRIPDEAQKKKVVLTPVDPKINPLADPRFLSG